MCTIQCGTNDAVHVLFPYKLPYPAQIKVVQEVFSTLDADEREFSWMTLLVLISPSNPGVHVLVECPTGTGKTLAILCSVMAWMTQRLGAAGHGAKRRRPGPVKLYYAARTHGQAKQVMRELNRTEYASSLGVSAVILGGRKRLCAMEPVRDCNQVDAACRTLVGVARNAAANGLPMAPPPSGGYDPKKYDCSVGCKYYHGERMAEPKVPGHGEHDCAVQCQHYVPVLRLKGHG